MEPYDLRRTYAHWLELAQIPRTRRKLYLGHSAGDITDLYERHEIDAFLSADGRTLRAWLATERESSEERSAAASDALPADMPPRSAGIRSTTYNTTGASDGARVAMLSL